MSGLQLVATTPWNRLPGDIDTLLVVGGVDIWTGDSHPKLLRWLHEQSKKVRRLGSVCTGAFVLAEAGLLDGRKATTHWCFTQKLKTDYPKVVVDSGSDIHSRWEDRHRRGRYVGHRSLSIACRGRSRSGHCPPSCPRTRAVRAPIWRRESVQHSFGVSEFLQDSSPRAADMDCRKSCRTPRRRPTCFQARHECSELFTDICARVGFDTSEVRCQNASRNCEASPDRQ